MKKVLVVDDETSILTLLTFNLEKAGYEVTTAEDGKTALEIALTNEFDFILLDLMLPYIDGIDITKKLRQEKIETPILILTAKDDQIDKIIGLEVGADDYLTKPFSPREVLARMKAIGRRVQKNTVQNDEQPSSKNITVGQLMIQPEQYEAQLNGVNLDLTPKEFELLLYFMKRKNRVLDRETLLDAIWQYDYSGQTRIVDVHVSHLRDKIEKDPKNPQYLLTIRGFGYKFQEPVLK